MSEQTPEVTIRYTMRFTQVYSKDMCENYGIDPDDEQWAERMAEADAGAVMEGELTIEEFTDSCEDFDVMYEVEPVVVPEEMVH